MLTAIALTAAIIALLVIALIWRGERRQRHEDEQRPLSPEESARREKMIADIQERLAKLRNQQQRIAQEAHSDPRRAADAVRKIMRQDGRPKRG